MVLSLVTRAFGTANDRYLKRLHKNVEAINALEPELEALDDAALRARTDAFRARLEAGEKVDDLLVEAFATVREAAKRTLGQRHFDVQLLGAMILHNGMISEMKTGEGKTLVATLAVYLNALEGKGVHVVTVNDYLAQRDSSWMGQIYEFLGLNTGCITNSMSDEERRAAYAADVTYGTNNEFGFDYLRDNMKFHLDEMVQRDFNFAIVDEVDSILIDEARTPLIISGPVEDSSEAYIQADKLMPLLVDEDFEVDEKARAATLTEEGVEHVETLLAKDGLLEEGAGLYDITSVTILHHVNQALRAHKLFQRDKDYISHEGRIVIIDEFTGRMMEGRRFSDGLHQALEAKEGVDVQNENQTLASITFQNYFRLYPKLGGMTGTAMTESAEFAEIYKLEVVDIPTHRPMVRDDQNDEVYRTLDEKYNAINELIEDANKRGQPVLVGTVSIEKSEEVSDALKARKIPHEVLNARHHEREAQIIGQAGVPGAVTIATNMAGRGTDIQLGGNLDMRLEAELADMEDGPARDEKEATIRAEVEKLHDEVIAAGGLMVIGTERHESRRIDNQLRGRSGRQGDPGTSRFFLSLQDDLMRIFGSERMDGMLTKLGIEEGEAIVHPWINKALEKAQQKVEARNFEIRKQLLQYDDVMNDQRKVIYEQRKDLMRTDDVSDTIKAMRAEALEDLIARTIPQKAFAEQWDTSLLHEETLRIFGLDVPVEEWAAEEGIADEEIHDRLEKLSDEHMAAKVANYGEEIMRMAEKNLLLQILDQHWKDHLLRLDHLRQGIGLRAFGQKNPLNEYKREAFDMFQDMLGRLREGVTQLLSHIEIQVNAPEAVPQPRSPQNIEAEHSTVGQFGDAAPRADNSGNAGSVARKQAAAATIDPEDPSTWGKVPRNAACPCGTGKKYKHCHGRSV
ncbi:MAG: preprotein translocase subunit SecA [Rhodospirillaceae bacterium]|jgi:preprotein translocase subunit SecA|nr:preprotein translocase subunit SecA [Rhodospirillaceae bacterium]MBT6535244.1 preprotein translocase subunit SecA [Rhodospirillaceae bacterium]